MYEHECAINYLHTKLSQISSEDFEIPTVISNAKIPMAVLDGNFQLICCSPLFQDVCAVEQQFNIYQVIGNPEKFVHLVLNILNHGKENRVILGLSKIKNKEQGKYFYYSTKVLQR